MSAFSVTDKQFHNRKSFVCPNYHVLKNFFENKNHDVNENFKAMFGAYIFLGWYLNEEKL